MNNIYTFLIFLIVLFLYFHITYQHKTSNDLEIYEIEDTVSKKRFEDILNMRQPVLFTFTNDYIYNISNTLLESKYSTNDIFIRNCDDGDSFYVPEKYANFVKLCDSDVKYISEYNSDILIDLSIMKFINQCDGTLRPYMLMNTTYDLITGTKGFIGKNLTEELESKYKVLNFEEFHL